VVSAFQAEAIRNLALGYADDPPPATFRVIVNPLAVWIWVGGLIALGGALFAVWPTAESRRRAEAAYAARLGRELSRG
jgi:cytochrome c-type biogenesis protein CcmF